MKNLSEISGSEVGKQSQSDDAVYQADADADSTFDSLETQTKMNNKRGRDYDADVDDSDSARSYDSTGKRKSFRRLITRFAEKTSMQGVPYINNAKLLGAKIIWSILLLIAIAALGIHLWFLITQYYDWPKQTKVVLGYSNLQFPDITICNTNPIHKTRFEDIKSPKELKQLISDLNPRNLVPDQFNANYDPLAPPDQQPQATTLGPNNQPPSGNTQVMTTLTGPEGTTLPSNTQQTRISRTTRTSLNSRPPLTGVSAASQAPTTQTPAPQVRKKRFVDEYEGLNLTSYNENFDNTPSDQQLLPNEYDGQMSSAVEIQEIFEELYMDISKNTRATIGHNISDMLLSCTFNGRICDSRQFRIHQTSEYGNCWILNSDKFTVQTSGPSGGLSLILYLEVQEYIKGLTTGYGTRIQIHEPGTIPYPAEEGLFIPSSMETDIGLKMTLIERIAGNYGDCAEGVEFNRLYKKKYTRRACQRLCEMLTVIQECECFSDQHEEIATSKNTNIRPCRSNKEKNCEKNELRKFNLKTSGCSCPNPCSEIQYSRSLSNRQWPDDDYARVLLQSICSDNKEVCAELRTDINDQRLLNNNFLKLNIYYEDLNFQNITEEPEIALAQFLSDVGGAVGLWIGLSILSFCEIIQLVVELFDYFVHRTVKRRRQEQRRASRRGINNANRSKEGDTHSKTTGEHNKSHTSHDLDRDKPADRGSPMSSPRFLGIDGRPPAKRSPLADRRLNDIRGYDSDYARHGSNDSRHHGNDVSRGLRYEDDYLRRNYTMGYS